MTDKLKPVRCGCGGEAKIDWALQPDGVYITGVYCENCGTKTIPFWGKEKDKAIDYAVTTWNRAMDAKDINVPNKFATDTNVGDKERTAKVEEDEWTEHKMLSRDYGKIYYQHDCCCYLYESPYQFCPYCGKKMKRKNHE